MKMICDGEVAAYGFLIGDDDANALRRALPGHKVFITDKAPLTVADIRSVGGPSPNDNSAVIFGFSAGCQSVRALLLAGMRPRAVVCADGTHDTLDANKSPPPHIAVWKDIVSSARNGGPVFAASCTQMSYVELIPMGKPGRAWSTRHVLEQATGLDLPPGREVHDNNLHVYSCPSATIDKAAHIRQQNETLPLMLSRHVLPVVEAEDQPPNRPVSMETLKVAQEDLNLGFKEETRNGGLLIERLFLTPLGLPRGSAYCAAGFTSWLRRGCTRINLTSPIKGGAAGINIQKQFAANGTWNNPSSVAKMLPGDCVIWDRSVQGKPETSWQRHVGIVVDIGRDVFWTIEANADRVIDPVSGQIYAVCMVERSKYDPRWLGFGRLD